MAAWNPIRRRTQKRGVSPLFHFKHLLIRVGARSLVTRFRFVHLAGNIREAIMPTLKNTGILGEVVWLGTVPAETVSSNGIRSQAANSLELTFDGPVGEGHGGLTRPACVRVRRLYPRGTEIANVRQLSVLSAEELDQVAAEMGLDRIDPAWLGASIILRGIPDFTHIPPSSRLWVEGGVSLTIDMENLPCEWPGKEIEAEHGGKGQAFPLAARDRRGVTAWVERPGVVRLGDQFELVVPTQRAWRGS
jgi:hypothetical protein